MERQNDSVLKYLILLFALSSFILIPVVNVRAASADQDKWYAGYWYNMPVTYPWGVKADIYRIDPHVPIWQFVCEWVSVIISYNPKYWVQTGYLLEWFFLWRRNTFYIEKWDVGGHFLRRYGNPYPGHTFTCAIWWDPDYLPPSWYWAILEGWTWLHWGHIYTNPYGAIDYQAFIESTTPSISITGSHFTKICYYDPSDPYNWVYWNFCVYDPDPPYVIDARFYYEFYAYGGG
jgi:hypothetical protein